MGVTLCVAGVGIFYCLSVCLGVKDGCKICLSFVYDITDGRTALKNTFQQYSKVTYDILFYTFNYILN